MILFSYPFFKKSEFMQINHGFRFSMYKIQVLR